MKMYFLRNVLCDIPLTLFHFPKYTFPVLLLTITRFPSKTNIATIKTTIRSNDRCLSTDRVGIFVIIYLLKYKRETRRNFEIVQVYCVDSFSVKGLEHESLESPIKRTTTRRNLSPLTILNA